MTNQKAVVVTLIGTNILTAVAAYSLRVHARKLRDHHEQQEDQAYKTIAYLVSMLAEHDVSLSEFDLIALGDMINIVDTNDVEDDDGES